MADKYISCHVIYGDNDSVITRGNGAHQVPSNTTPQELLLSMLKSIGDDLKKDGVVYKYAVITSVSKL